MNNFYNILYKIRGSIVKHSPEILTSLGITSMIASTVYAVKVTPKAKKKVDEFTSYNKMIYKKGNLNPDDFRPKYTELIGLVWKDYLPAALLSVSGASFIVSANHINKKRNALLTAAYTLSESTLIKYKDRVMKDLGTDKAKEIDRKVREEIKLDKKDNINHKLNKVDEKEFIIIDSFSGLKMPKGTTLNKVESVLNSVNKIMNYDMYVCADEWYDRLGFKHIPKCAENVGWKLEDGLIEITQNPGLDEDGVPAMYVNFINLPKEDYYKFS